MPETARLQLPYPSAEADPWYDDFVRFVTAVDQVLFTTREDRGYLLTGGGTMTFTAGSGSLTWSAAIQILSAPTGFQWSIAAGSVSLNDGEILYAKLTRSPVGPLTIQTAIGTQVPASPSDDPNSVLVIAQRRGTLVYFRNGKTIATGDSGPVLSMSSLSAAGTLTVKDEGSTLSSLITKLNFVGSGVVASINGGDSTQVDVTVSGGGGGGTPSDTDPLNVASAVPTPGTGTDYSRWDHVHAHGNLIGGALHALANGSTAGFMSSADFTKLGAFGAASTYVTLAGAQTITGVKTVAIDDVTTNAITNVFVLAHTTTGTPANGLGTGLLFQAENSANAIVDQALVASLWLDVTSTSEDSALTWSTRTAGAALAERMRLGMGLSIGNTIDPGPGGALVPNNKSWSGLDADNTTVRSLAKMDASGFVVLGDTGVTQLSTVATDTLKGYLNSVADFVFVFATTAVTLGTGAGSATPGSYTLKGVSAAGTNIAGATLTVQAPLGTGNATPGLLVWQTGTVQGSGTTVHVAAERMRLTSSLLSTQVPASFTTNDATNNAVVNVVTVVHTTSGSPANGLGTGVLLRTQNSIPATVDLVQTAGLWLDVNASSEDSAWTWSTRTAGAALAERLRLAQGLMVGNTIDPGPGSISVPNNVGLYGLDTNNTTLRSLARVDSTGVVAIGDTGSATLALIAQTTVEGYLGSLSSVIFAFAATAGTLGANDGTATPGNYALQGTTAVGSNIAGATLTMQAPLGTGNATAGPIVWKTGTVQASGTTTHVAAERMRLTSTLLSTTVPVTFVTDDAINAGLTTILTLRHTTSGTAAAGHGVKFSWEAENDTGSAVVQAQESSAWTDPTTGTETAAWVRNLMWAGTVTSIQRAVAVSTTGWGFAFGGTATAALTSAPYVGLFFDNNTALAWRTTGSTWVKGLSLDGSDAFLLGSSGNALSMSATVAIMDAATSWTLKLSGVVQLTVSTTGVLIAGSGEATTTPGDYTFRGAAGTGTNVNAGTVRIRGSKGTGSGTTGPIVFEVGAIGTSGTTAHATTTIAQMTDTSVALNAVTTATTTDTTTNAPVTVLNLNHALSTGTAAAGMGAGLTFQSPDDGGTMQTQIALAGVWTTATHASRVAALSFYTVNAASISEVARLRGDGALRIGDPTTVSSAEGPGVSLGVSTVLRGLNNASSAYLDLVKLSGSGDDILLGATGSSKNGTIQSRAATSTLSSGSIALFQHNATVAQSSTAAYVAIQCNITETSTGSGDNLLLDLEVGSSRVFAVAHNGYVVMKNNVALIHLNNAGSTYYNSVKFTNSDVMQFGDSALTTALQFMSGMRLALSTVSDADHTFAVTETTVVYTTLTATRTVTLPSASSAGAGFIAVVKDGSGNATSSVKISVVPPSGTIETLSSVDIVSAYGGAAFVSDGTNWYKWVE